MKIFYSVLFFIIALNLKDAQASTILDPELIDNAEKALEYLEGHLPEGYEFSDKMRLEGKYILACENHKLNPEAISATGDHGLWQINRRWQEGRVIKMGYTWQDMYDPHINTIIAITIFNEQDWTPWSCRKYIP